MIDRPKSAGALGIALAAGAATLFTPIRPGKIPIKKPRADRSKSRKEKG